MADKIFPDDYTRLTPVTGSEKVMSARNSDSKPFFILVSDIIAGLVTGSAMSQAITTALQGYVAAVPGKGLSANDFTNILKQKLDGLTSGGGGAEYTREDLLVLLGIEDISGLNTGDQVFKTINGHDLEGEGNVTITVPAVTSAYAGSEKSTVVNTPRYIGDSKYTVAEGTTLATISWAFNDSSPSGLSATINNGNTLNPTISGLSVAGLYTFQMNVTDSAGGTAQSVVSINVFAAASSGGVSLGETSTTAYRGDRGKTAYDFTQAQSAINAAKADLVAGKVPAEQLPAYVDDVLEFADLASMPATGVTGVIYVALNNNWEYRWSGSAYVRLVASPGTTTEVPEGTNLYFTTARVLATLLVGYSSVTGTITSADSVLTAINKLMGNIGLKSNIATTQVSLTALTFAADSVSGTIAAPITANITGVTTGAVLGAVCLVIHNSGTAPTFDSKFKKLSGSGTYVISQVNYIYCQYIDATHIIYSINQSA